MHIHFIFLGKTVFPEMDSGIKRYFERICHYTPASIQLVKAEKIAGKISEEAVREKEADRILALLEKQDYLLVWDQGGKQMDSVEFSGFWQKMLHEGRSKVWSAIGGPLGLSPRVLERANSVLSLSRMTFPHDLARLMVMEQIYRAFSIMKGEPYHK